MSSLLPLILTFSEVIPPLAEDEDSASNTRVTGVGRETTDDD